MAEEEFIGLANFIELRNRNVGRPNRIINLINPIIEIIDMAQYRNRVGNVVGGDIINNLWDQTGNNPAPPAQGDPEPLNPKQIMLPCKFTGDTNKLAEFLTDYAMYADAYRWSEAIRILRLPLHMEGVARRVVLEVPIADKTWIGIGRILNEKLLVDTPAKIHRQLFIDRMQKTHESVQQFAYDLKVLVVRAYPENFTQAQRDEFLLEQFLRGIKKEYRHHIMISGADTFEIALKKAHTMEYMNKRDNPVSAVTPYKNPNNFNNNSRDRSKSRERISSNNKGWSNGNNTNNNSNNFNGQYSSYGQRGYRGDGNLPPMARQSTSQQYYTPTKNQYHRDRNNNFGEYRRDGNLQPMARQPTQYDYQPDQYQNNGKSAYAVRQKTPLNLNAPEYIPRQNNNYANNRDKTNINGQLYCTTCRRYGHLPRSCFKNEDKFPNNYTRNVKQNKSGTTINLINPQISKTDKLKEE